MRRGRRIATLALLTLTATVAAQDKPDAYDEHMRQGDAQISRQMYDEALKEYKKAYSLTDKTSLEAEFGMAMAYRGLGAHKNFVDLMSTTG